MNDSESMDHGVSWFLFDHSVDDLVPSVEAVPVGDGVGNGCLMDLP